MLSNKRNCNRNFAFSSITSITSRIVITSRCRWKLFGHTIANHWNPVYFAKFRLQQCTFSRMYRKAKSLRMIGFCKKIIRIIFIFFFFLFFFRNQHILLPVPVVAEVEFLQFPCCQNRYHRFNSLLNFQQQTLQILPLPYLKLVWVDHRKPQH